MRTVDVVPLRPERFDDALEADASSALTTALRDERALLDGRRLWHVSSTATGGGVAEILRPLTGYQVGAGWGSGWLVIEGGDEFFAVTKRFHNRLHGRGGDGELGRRERSTYERALAGEVDELRATIHADDIVVLHDPQTLGLAPALAAMGTRVVWVCHIGIDEPNDVARATWDVMRAYLEPVRICVFSRPTYVWDGIEVDRVRIVPPGIDPFSAKNQLLDVDAVRDVLHATGLLCGPARHDASFERADGSRGRIRERVRTLEDAPVPPDAPVVAQVSRWDRLKDHAGVLRSFADRVPGDAGAHLVLAGPEPDGVGDDPEQQAVLDELTRARASLPSETRARTHLVCMPIGDVDASHAIVNALQRHAAVVTQKSLAEGFGLTVAEGMWKSRPVVAGRVGGIQDQIEDGRTGVLVDPEDLTAFGAAVASILEDPRRGAELGRRAHEAVRDRFLLSRYLVDQAGVLADAEGRRERRAEAV